MSAGKNRRKRLERKRRQEALNNLPAWQQELMRRLGRDVRGIR